MHFVSKVCAGIAITTVLVINESCGRGDNGAGRTGQDSGDANILEDTGLGDSTIADSSAGDIDSGDAERDGDGGTDVGADLGTDAAAKSGSDAGAGEASPDAVVDTGMVDSANDSGRVDSGKPDAGSPTFSNIYTSIIMPNCLPCHSPGPGEGFNIGKLDMGQQGATYTNLVGLIGTGVGAMGVGAGTSGILCASVTGLLLVKPRSAATSLLWETVNSKVQGAMPPCGSPMPVDGGALAQAQVDQIATWIDQGAANN